MTMVGLDVGNQTLFNRQHLKQFSKTHGPENDFLVMVLDFLIGLSEKFGDPGTPMYDPLAVGAAIDPTIVKTQAMRVDVETRGEFSRIIEGVDRVTPNVQVCTGVDAERFIQLFISRVQGK